MALLIETFLEVSDTLTRFSLYKEDNDNLRYRFYLTSVDGLHTWPFSETNENNHVPASKIRYILVQINTVYEYELLERGLTRHLWKYFLAKRLARRCRAIYARRRKAANIINAFIETCYFDPHSAYCKQRLLKEYQELIKK